MESGDVKSTAQCLRALQAYGAAYERPLADDSIRRAGAWLLKAQPDGTQERTYQVLGLHWAHAGNAAVVAAGRRPVSLQRPGGGWAPLPTPGSDAHATGQAPGALLEAGGPPPRAPRGPRGGRM